MNSPNPLKERNLLDHMRITISSFDEARFLAQSAARVARWPVQQNGWLA
jgi:hypothetical protein